MTVGNSVCALVDGGQHPLCRHECWMVGDAPFFVFLVHRGRPGVVTATTKGNPPIFGKVNIRNSQFVPKHFGLTVFLHHCNLGMIQNARTVGIQTLKTQRSFFRPEWYRWNIVSCVFSISRKIRETMASLFGLHFVFLSTNVSFWVGVLSYY